MAAGFAMACVGVWVMVLHLLHEVELGKRQWDLERRVSPAYQLTGRDGGGSLLLDGFGSAGSCSRLHRFWSSGISECVFDGTQCQSLPVDIKRSFSNVWEGGRAFMASKNQL